MKSGALRDKTKHFAVRIIRFVSYLRDEKREFVISKQILRSAASVGANVRESWNAQSRSDFQHKLSIALKEADETAYWLELLVESEIIDRKQFDSLYSDLDEIIAMLTASVKTMKATNLSTLNSQLSTQK
ncbi:MAG: four helix bundle protein [Rikenellaceae bacterium]|nr:four helix bundle protein [Rikenellaceae bacterium]